MRLFPSASEIGRFQGCCHDGWSTELLRAPWDSDDRNPRASRRSPAELQKRSSILQPASPRLAGATNIAQRNRAWRAFMLVTIPLVVIEESEPNDTISSQ